MSRAESVWPARWVGYFKKYKIPYRYPVPRGDCILSLPELDALWNQHVQVLSPGDTSLEEFFFDTLLGKDWKDKLRLYPLI